MPQPRDECERDDGKARTVDERPRNPAYARTLAAHGAKSFYSGDDRKQRLHDLMIALPPGDPATTAMRPARSYTIAALEPKFQALGHVTRVIEQASGLQAIARAQAGWDGGADPRREGVVLGD